MDRSLTLESVRLTEAAAMFAGRLMGRGDAEAAYNSAAEAMLGVFDRLSIYGSIVAGAENPESPIRDGAVIGNESEEYVEIVVKPLDGKDTCARGSSNAASYLAMGGKNSFLPVPAVPMYKIASGPDGRNIIDIEQSPEINIKRIARAKGKYIEDVTVCVLEKDWNLNMVKEIQQCGARIHYIRDGDISGAIATAMDDNAIDLLMGIGWAKDAVMAGAALKCLGGDLQGKLVALNSADNKIISSSGLSTDQIFMIEDLVPGDDIIISATGITDGVLLRGVRFIQGGARTTSLAMRLKTHTVRSISTRHRFDFKPVF